MSFLKRKSPQKMLFSKKHPQKMPFFLRNFLKHAFFKEKILSKTALSKECPLKSVFFKEHSLGKYLFLEESLPELKRSVVDLAHDPEQGEPSKSLLHKYIVYWERRVRNTYASSPSSMYVDWSGVVWWPSLPQLLFEDKDDGFQHKLFGSPRHTGSY